MRAGFEVIGDKDDAQYAKLPLNTLTAAIGDLLELTTGATTWAKCTSSSNHFTPKAILEETATAATSASCYLLTGNENVRAESSGDAVVAHYGDLMLLTDENTVNNSGTNSTAQQACFRQTGVAGALTDKRIIGRVLVGNGVDPDAA